MPKMGEKHHNGGKYPDTLVAEARRLHALGASRGFIARRLRVPYDTMRDWLENRTRIF